MSRQISYCWAFLVAVHLVIVFPSPSSFLSGQLLALETIQTMSAIIPITRSTPTQTPAWKMSPAISQPLRATAERTKVSFCFEPMRLANGCHADRVNRVLIIAQTLATFLSKGLPTQHLNGSFALPAVDAFVTEIDALYRSTVAGKVDGFCAGPLFEAVTQRGLESFVILEGNDHIGDLYRSVFDPQLKLLKATFASAYVDLIVVIFEIHLAATQHFPFTGGVRSRSYTGHE